MRHMTIINNANTLNIYKQGKFYFKKNKNSQYKIILLIEYLTENTQLIIKLILMDIILNLLNLF